MKKILICLFIIGSNHFLLAQQKVENEAFNAMLSELLSHSVPEVVPSQLKLSDSIIFLDAREKTEYTVSHIKNAVWIGYSDFKMKRLKGLNKDTKIIVYCSVGYRSEKIVEKLIKKGYSNVLNLYGGIFEWVHQNHTIVDYKGATNNVHAFDENWAKWLLKGTKKFTKAKN